MLVAGQHLVGPGDGIAGVLAQAVVELGEVQVEVLEEKLGADAVGQRDTEAAAVFAHPVFQGGVLALAQAPQLLVHHQPLVRHGADQRQVELIGQVRVAGADELAGEVAAHDVDHFALGLERQAPPRGKVGHAQVGQLFAAEVFLQPVELLIELASDVFQGHIGVFVTVAQLADQGQHRLLEHDAVQHRADDADVQLAVDFADVDIAQVETEQAKKALVIRGEVFAKARVEQKAQLAFTHVQAGELFQLIAQCRDQVTELFPGTHDEVVFHIDVGVLVQHGLHHGEGVVVGVEQALDHRGVVVVGTFHGGSP